MKISEAPWCVLDVETTGLDPAKDKLVEFAMLDSHGFTSDFLVNPGMPIPPDVSAVHHLTARDVIDALPHEEALKRIERMVMPSYLVVAHNAPFDRSFLPCLEDRMWLDTRRFAQHLFPDAPNHKNQTLRYYLLKEPVDLMGQAPHRAMSDVLVTTAIFKVLLQKYFEARGDNDGTVEELIAFAESPILISKMPFGKHFDEPLTALREDYIAWCLKNITDKPDLTYSLKNELERRKKTT